VRRTLTEIISTSGGAGIMSIGALLAGWSGSNIFGSLMEALNVAYDVKESRPWWKRQLIRLTCLLLAGVIILLATFVLVDGERVAGWAGSAFELGSAGITAWIVIQSLLAVLLLVALCVTILKLLPCVSQRWGHVIVASVVTTLLWVAATLLFRLYVQHFGSFNKTYGTIGGVIALLSWMYYTMFVVLSGGELASELHHGSGAIDPRPGAIYLGRIVSEEGPGTASMEKVKPAR
jgi:membrane protein